MDSTAVHPKTSEGTVEWNDRAPHGARSLYRYLGTGRDPTTNYVLRTCVPVRRNSYTSDGRTHGGDSHGCMTELPLDAYDKRGHATT